MIKTLRYAICVAAAAIAMQAQAGRLVINGSSHAVIEETPTKDTGLNDLYIIYDTKGVTATYTASSDNVAWYKYSNGSAAYKEQIPTRVSGKEHTIDLEAKDMGYVIEDGNSIYYCWIVDYATHFLDLSGLEPDDVTDCNSVRLIFSGKADAITYYTITGVPKTLSRDLHLEYHTLHYDAIMETYVDSVATQTFNFIKDAISATAPLCSTDFTLSGDRFLVKWGEEQSITPNFNYEPVGVEAETRAVQQIRESDNEQKVETEGLGGSAPVYITFTAAVTDAAIFREWQMSRDQEFQTIDDRYQQLEFDYTFRDEGVTYIRFVANNADGTCEYVGDTYTVTIGESSLLCPNAFSPGSSEGINDEWKVSYKSIIEFQCSIFNRWGQHIISFSDPSMGWDGKYHGKLVPAGVYFYVIKARGSDGKTYNLKGDINIVRSKSNGTGGGGDKPVE